MFFSRFEEEIFTTGEVRDSCIPISSPSEDQPMALYIGVTLTAFLLAVVVAYFFYRSYRKQSNMHCFSGGYLIIGFVLEIIVGGGVVSLEG